MPVSLNAMLALNPEMEQQEQSQEGYDWVNEGYGMLNSLGQNYSIDSLASAFSPGGAMNSMPGAGSSFGDQLTADSAMRQYGLSDGVWGAQTAPHTLEGMNPEAWNTLTGYDWSGWQQPEQAVNYGEYSSGGGDPLSIAGNQELMQGYRQRLADYFGEGGFTRRVSQDQSDRKLRELAYVDSNGRTLGSHEFFHGDPTGLDQFMNIAIPAIIAVGTGGMGAAVGGAAGLGAVGAGAVGGATAGYTSSAMAGQNPLQGTVTGALAGGLNSYVSAGATDALSPYVEQMGNNPSAYQPGMISPQTAQSIGNAVGNVASTAVRGGDIGQSLISGGLNVGGSFAAPYVNQGLGDLSNMFSSGGTTMPDSYGLGGDMDYFNQSSPSSFGSVLPQNNGGFEMPAMVGQQSTGGGNGIDWSQVAQQAQQTYGNQPQQQEDPSSLSSIFGGQQAQRMGAPSFATPTPNTAAPNSVGPNTDYLEYFKKNGMGAGMEALKVLNPRMYQVLSGMGLGGQQGRGPGQMSYLQGAAGLLASMYASRQNKKALQAPQQNLQGLQNMFGPNSPYAQQLRQQLERKDAAGGRRSQYGPREVELQAALARQNAGIMPQVAGQQMQLAQMQNQNRLAPLQNLMYAAQGTGLLNDGQKYLEDMFSNVQTPFGPGVPG